MRHLAALEDDLARVGRLDAGQALHERALAGAVVADERDDLARVHGEVRAAQRAHAAEALDDAAGLEQGLGHVRRSFRRGRGSGAARRCSSNRPAATPGEEGGAAAAGLDDGRGLDRPEAPLAASTASSRAQPPVTTRRRRAPGDASTRASWRRPARPPRRAWRARRARAGRRGQVQRRALERAEVEVERGRVAGSGGDRARVEFGAVLVGDAERRRGPPCRRGRTRGRRGSRGGLGDVPADARPAATTRSIASASSGGATTRTSASAVPHESRTSPGAGHPGADPAPRWSWPATVRTAPPARRERVAARPAGVPARTRSGRRSSRSAGPGERVGERASPPGRAGRSGRRATARSPRRRRGRARPIRRR